ncbi:MAG: restriction endonuclease subunit S [Gammaproteobacteria bacterium]|nr:restriction endonuclease subunit S [Gammaproteobacteria bacterium]
MLRITDIQNGQVEWARVPRCEIAPDKQGHFLLSPGDIVFARTGGTVGKSFLIREVPEPAVFASYLIKVAPTRGVEPRYLYWFFQSLDYWEQIALKKGGLQGNVNAKTLGSIELPIAPTNEQRRIVGRVEALFDEIDRGVESLRTARSMIALYRQSLLKSAFEGRLTADWRAENPGQLESPADLLARTREEREQRHSDALDEWDRVVAEWERDGENSRQPAKPKPPTVNAATVDVPEGLGTPRHWLWLSMSTLGRVTGGLTKNQKRSALPLEAKYLRVANVYSNRLVLDEIKEIGITEDELRKTRLAEGDLLFVEGNGSIEQIGRVAVWDGSIPDMTHQNHLIRFSPNGLLSSRFALYFMVSPIGRSRITAQASSTSGLHTLSISKVGSLPVPVCSRAEQVELVRRLDVRFEAADLLVAEIDASLARAEALRQSTLKKAFSGQLVPQKPTDEPASALLARIRHELAGEPAKGHRTPAAIARA